MKFTAVKAVKVVKVVTMKITAGEAVAVVKKDMASGNKPSVVKNHETTAPVAAPEAPAPREVMMKMADGKTHRTKQTGRRRNRRSPGTPPAALRIPPMDRRWEHRRLEDSSVR